MTLLGKVFIYLIFVLSVIFFALSVAVNATHINQKKAAAAAQTRATNAEAKNTQLSTQLEQLQGELAIEQIARRATLAALQTELTSLSAELRTKEADLVAKTAKETELIRDAAATNADLKARSEENKQLRMQIVATQQNLSDVLASYVATKDAEIRLQGTYDTLLARSAQANDDYTAAISQLEILGVDEKTPLNAPPAVNGQVLAVNTNGMLEVSLGRDDGIRAGFTLDVSRRGQYLGRVRVTTVRDDKSVAEILTGFQRGAIIEGDRVDSKLY